MTENFLREWKEARKRPELKIKSSIYWGGEKKTQSLASSVISYSQAFPLQWWIETYIDSLNFCALILWLKVLTSRTVHNTLKWIKNELILFHLLLLRSNGIPCSLTSFVATQLIEGMLSAVFENVFVSISKSESLFTPYINKSPLFFSPFVSEKRMLFLLIDVEHFQVSRSYFKANRLFILNSTLWWGFFRLCGTRIHWSL